jgi:ABC-type multidrug transport system ATPase subunit
MSTETAIRTEGLTKHYTGVKALSDLTLDVPAGSIYGFLGPNGAGKTTTLKILGGLIAPSAGTASVAGVPLSEGTAFRREIGYLAQEPRFYDWMTGRETLEFVGSLVGDTPAGCASGWGSPRPSSPARASCSSTSRSAPSTPWDGARCSS